MGTPVSKQHQAIATARTPAAASAAASPSVLPLVAEGPMPSPRRCACGGGCPQCCDARLQAKPTLGAAGDRYEREADRIAQQIVQPGLLPAPAPLTPISAIPAPAVQSKPDVAAPSIVDSDTATRVSALHGRGQALPAGVRANFQAVFGHDLGAVRIHEDADAARALRAKAFTIGSDIVFGADRYAPHTSAGRALLAHELVHVLQQRGHQHRIQRDEEESASAPASARERPVIVITFPGWIWFTNLEGRYLVRVQADWLATEIYGMSQDEAFRLYQEQRRPNIADPSLPVERFIGELESRTQMTLLPEARAELVARGRIPLQEYGDFHYAAFVDEADLVRWFGPAQWQAYLAREPGEESGAAAGGEAEAVTAGEPTTAGGFTALPIHADRSVLAGNHELSLIYLILCEHFTGLQITDAIDRMAANGLDGGELASIIGRDVWRQILTDLFTQGWREFRAACGSDVIVFERLIERILEQYQRGNITARANRLEIGHGIPEREVLGIVHRNSRLLMYDALGMPLRGFTGIAYRDPGFIGFEPPSWVVETAETLRELGISIPERDALVANLFSQALVADEIMVAQAVDLMLANLDAVAQRVRTGLGEEVLRVLGETVTVLAIFMLGHAFARLLMRLRNLPCILAGLALEGALRAAGYMLGLQFLGQSWELLLQAAFHLSRVRNDEDGRPTRLSEVHMEQAARPVRQLIANMAVVMGVVAFGATVRRVRAGESTAVWDNPNEPLRELLTRAREPAPGETRPPEAPAVVPPVEAPPAAPPPPASAEVASAASRAAAPPLPSELPRAEPGGAAPAAGVAPAPPAPTIAPVVTPPEPVRPAEPAPAPAAAAAAPQVWVNTRSGRYHLPGSRWYGRTTEGTYMTLAEARARGFTEAGTRPAPVSGVYSVERPTLGDPRVVIRAWIGAREARAGLEREMMSAGEYAIAELAGWQRAHSTGAGLGAESGEAIRLAPELVNQALQNRGIEAFLRGLRDLAEVEGERLHLTTETTSQPRTLRLASIHYLVEMPEGGRMITLFEAAIEVRPDGTARAGVRLPGSDTYTWGPWLE
jgi:hypothetical protein